MKYSKAFVFAIIMIAAAQISCAATDLNSIRDAVKKSSPQSGYGYFIAVFIPNAEVMKAARDEAEQQAKENQKNDASNIQPVTPKDYRIVIKAYWAFSGDKWRYDWTTLFPEDRAGGMTQVAWDGVNATSLIGVNGFIWNGMGHARQQAQFDMIAPLATSEDKIALNDESAKYIGDEQINGETVHHITAKIVSLNYDLWISPSRSYQTIKMRRASDPGMGRVNEYQVLSFKQYDGVWIPERVEELKYEQKDGKLFNPDTRRFQTLEFHANIPIPDSEFKVRFPVGININGPEPNDWTQVGQPVNNDTIQSLLAPLKDQAPIAEKPGK